MEVGDKLKELNMTADEVQRLTKALKDEKFGEMLRDYARELSDPENKKRYEEEIKLLEEERGNTIEFVHPEPFRSLRTSVNGRQKCFINICANEKIGKPECKWGVSEDGHRGQRWSLPHSLHPGRQDTDPKGNKIMIYDVIFHPDTLHLASRNARFMDMVDSTATQGIQDAFKVTLDKNNVREMSIKYKGTPQPCVIRRPIPGYKTKEHPEAPDPLAFPYLDEKRPPTSPQSKPATNDKSDAKPTSFSILPPKAKEPTKPNYTVKFRSFVDLQDFRCSRDSAQSPRPKEIVVTIDVPLLKAASDASLEVKERQLLLESEKPAYRLELPLAYPVDEDKGEAKFNKQRGQLTVTLPVLPSSIAFDFALGSAQTGVTHDEREGERREMDEEDEWKERESEKSDEEEQRCVEEDLRQQARVENGEEEGERGQEKGEEPMKDGQEGVAREEREADGKETWREQRGEGGNGEEGEIGVEEQKRGGQESLEGEKLKEQKNENAEEVGNFNQQKRQRHEDKSGSGPTGSQCDTVDVSAGEENSLPVNGRVPSPEAENPSILSCIGKEGEVNLHSCLESPPKTKTSDIKEEIENTRESVHGNEKVETDAAFLHRRSSETSTAADSHGRNNMDGSVPSESDETSATVKQEEREGEDEDYLPTTAQMLHNPEHNKPPPALLREIDKDGNEKIISDHFTSAGFIFQNSLMYELD